MTALLDLREHLPITNPTWIFFLVLCIILFAPVLLNKLKIPHLIGMILAGILIGEHGFDILPATAVSNCSDRWDSTTSCS